MVNTKLKWTALWMILKKEVLDNRHLFKQNAPFSVDKNYEYDNTKPLEKL